MEDDQEQGFYYQIPGGLLDKDVIEIHGSFLGDSDISVKLLAEDTSSELTRTLPFGFLLTSRGKWSVEVIDGTHIKNEKSGDVGLSEMGVFKIRIIAYNENYELYVNDTKLLTQAHVVPLTAVSHLAIDGEAEFTSVEFKDLNSEAESAQSEGIATSRSSSSASRSQERLPEIASQPGFIRLSQSRRSYNRKPNDPVLLPVNSSIQHRDVDIQPFERSGEGGDMMVHVEPVHFVESVPPQSGMQADVTGGQLKVNTSAKARTMPVPTGKDKEKRRSSSRLFDKLHRKKSADRVLRKESQDSQAEGSARVWQTEDGVEMSVDSKEIYKGGKQSSLSEPNISVGAKDGKEAKRKTSRHSVFSRHSKESKDNKKRSASSPPNALAVEAKSSKNENDKKKRHSSRLSNKFGSHKHKTDKLDSKKADPGIAVTGTTNLSGGTSNAQLVQAQEVSDVYAVAGVTEISDVPAHMTPLTSNASLKNKHSMHVKPYQRGSYNLHSAEKGRLPTTELVGLKSVATLPDADEDTNLHRLPRNRLDTDDSTLVNQKSPDENHAFATLPSVDTFSQNHRTRLSSSSGSPNRESAHKDIPSASGLGALETQRWEDSRDSSASPQRKESAKDSHQSYVLNTASRSRESSHCSTQSLSGDGKTQKYRSNSSGWRASDKGRESWDRFSHSSLEAPSKEPILDNLQSVVAATVSDDVQHSMPPQEGNAVGKHEIADAEFDITGRRSTSISSSRPKNSTSQTGATFGHSVPFSASSHNGNSLDIKQNTTGSAGKVGAAAVAVGGTATKSKNQKGKETKKADKKENKKSKDKKAKSESAINESADREKHKKRHKVADAFRRIFHRKKKSKDKNSAPSKLDVTGAGTAGALPMSTALQKSVSQSHSESEYDSEFSSSGSSLSIENAQVNNPALAASVLHGDARALDDNYSVAALATDTSTFYPRHIEVPVAELHNDKALDKSEVGVINREIDNPSDSRWHDEPSNGRVEQSPSMVPAMLSSGKKRRSSSSSHNSDLYERGSEKRIETSRSTTNSPSPSRKQADTIKQTPLVVSSEATAQQHNAPPITIEESSSSWKEDDHVPTQSQLTPTSVSQDYQYAIPATTNHDQLSSWDGILTQPPVPVGGTWQKTYTGSNNSSRSSSRSDGHARYTQPLIEVNNDNPTQQYSGAPGRRHQRLSSSSSSSCSSITSQSGRIILVGQSHNFILRMNSYRRRGAVGLSKNEHKTLGADPYSLSSSSTSSISSIDSEKLPASLIKLKLAANVGPQDKNAVKTRPQTQKAAESKFIQKTAAGQGLQSHQPLSIEGTTGEVQNGGGNPKYPRPKYDSSFWDDIVSDSSSGSTSPKLSTLPGTRTAVDEPASKHIGRNGY
ncbi:hypothetical protein SprV_0401537400 [Sparganum proliferum]